MLTWGTWLRQFIWSFQVSELEESAVWRECDENELSQRLHIETMGEETYKDIQWKSWVWWEYNIKVNLMEIGFSVWKVSKDN